METKTISYSQANGSILVRAGDERNEPHGSKAPVVKSIHGIDMTRESDKKCIINQNMLPDNFPTHLHQPEFWQSLGRAVATFGFLEEVLTKAIFAFTGTRPYQECDIEIAYKKWLPMLDKSLSDQLGGLIDTYGKAVREHPDFNVDNITTLLDDLRKASRVRNVLCHGSWRLPNDAGKSLPFFVNRQNEIFDTEIDCSYLDQVQEHAACLACAVIDTVTIMGFQFPGSNGPGVKIWDRGN